jgi:shikimate kinase
MSSIPTTKNLIQKSISLIGFMGSGKSTVGKILADLLAMPFIDTDEYLTSMIGMSIPEYFDKYGEKSFRNIEKECVQEIENWKPSIIATGGGLPCYNENMDLLLQSSTTFYLKVSVSQIIARTKRQISQRPLIKKWHDEGKLEIRIAEKLSEREAYYLRAHHTIDAGQPIETMTNLIIESLKKA